MIHIICDIFKSILYGPYRSYWFYSDSLIISFIIQSSLTCILYDIPSTIGLNIGHMTSDHMAHDMSHDMTWSKVINWHLARIPRLSLVRSVARFVFYSMVRSIDYGP